MAGFAGLMACTVREPVDIGFVAGLSGRAADLGISERNGAQLAIDDLNAAGGLGGRTLRLLVRDDEQRPERTAAAVAELAASGVAFVIGPMTSSTAVAGAHVANERRLVMISPAGTTHELSRQADHFYRCVADAPLAARQIGEFLHAQGSRAIAVLGDANNAAFVDSFAQAVGTLMRERGGRVLADTRFRSGAEASLVNVAANALVGGPDTLVLIAGAVDAALLAQQLRRLDPELRIAVTPWAGTEQFLQLGGRAIEGAFVPQYFDRSSRAEAFVRFALRYRERFGEEPGFPATIAYDAVTMGVAALAARTPGQTLKQSLDARREYPGLQRPTRIDTFGDGAGEVYMTVVRDGRYEPAGR